MTYYNRTMRRLRALTMLETIMVLVVFGLIVVAAITAGQNLLANQRGKVASQELRQLVSVVNDVTQGRKDYTGITSETVAPLLPDNMRDGANILISNGAFPVVIAPGNTTADLVTAPGSNTFSGSNHPKKTYQLRIGSATTPIRDVAVCTSLAGTFNDADPDFLGVLLQDDEVTTVVDYISARRYGGTAGQVIPATVTMGTPTAKEDDIVLSELTGAEWTRACTAFAADTAGATMTLAFR